MALHSSKTALVVGGSHGIGLSTAQLLISHGAKVLITGRSSPPIKAAQEKLGDEAKIVPCDITSSAAISDLVQTAESYFGVGNSIDLLFINAGYAALEPFVQVSEETYRRQFDTNVFGPFFVAQKLAPKIKRGGSIVFTTSVANQVGFPGMAIYSSTKAAVQSFVQTMAAELASQQIRVNAVAPGFVKTPTMGVANASPAELKEFEGQGAQTTPLGRIGEPEEIAKAVVFLAFDATFTTGSQLVMDGGLGSTRVH